MAGAAAADAVAADAVVVVVVVPAVVRPAVGPTFTDFPRCENAAETVPPVLTTAGAAAGVSFEVVACC